MTFMLSVDLDRLKSIFIECTHRPLNYMFFTPLYGVGIQDVPKLAKKITPHFFLGVIDPLKRFLHLKMVNSAPK
jgi:hypothetical protein